MKPAHICIAVLVGPLRLAGMLTLIGSIAVMLMAQRPRALPKIA